MKKKSTRYDYISRINSALDFIIRNLHRSIALKDIAGASNFSEYHFHRIFHSLLNETVNDYVSRKRLERAAQLLVYDLQTSLTAIAEKCGFSSPANFSKAFKKHFGYTPSQFRDPTNKKNSKIGKIKSKYGKEFSPKDLYPELNSVLLDENKLEELNKKVKIREIKEIPIVFISSKKGYEIKSVYAAWNKLSTWAEVNLPAHYGELLSNSAKTYGIGYDNDMITPRERCRYHAAVEVKSDIVVKSPFFKSTIASGKYAVTHVKGSVEDAMNAYKDIFGIWLATNGCVPDDYPVIERYFNDPRKDGYIELEILVKVKPLS